ncbi:uncharacterized protein V1516DRAFT_669011 [Lipomyces oligophaga]|uniref:uncharacterized protein n=1 Tax=Lipomyces oligophaga TaxID=45792 RepID=UPI0034CD0302
MTLEAQRYALEDIDRLENAIAERLVDPPRKHREKLAQQHEIALFLERIQQQSQFLLDSFRDDSGETKKEQALVKGIDGDPFDEFYRQLREIRDFHRRYPNQQAENLQESYKRQKLDDDNSASFNQMSSSRPAMMDSAIDTMFSGEEMYGRYLDLVSFHEQYLNIRNIKHVSYVQYLDIFDKFDQIPKTSKDDMYFKYLVDLAFYLADFLKRTQPLSDPDGIISKIQADFDIEWSGQVESQATETNPLYCSACEKLFEKQTVFDAHLSSKKHKRNAQSSAGGPTSTSISNLKTRAIAQREYEISKLVEILEKQRTNTRLNVERKSALTVRERQLEMEAVERGDFLSDDEQDGDNNDDDDSNPQTHNNSADDDSKIYNPLKLPIGWDGKPIPFWLWKLHGLGVEHPCEICGNFVYMGRKAFDRHFNEPRHIHGLRCLGINNSALFREITSIHDALSLWDRLKKEKRAQDSVREQAVQVEDDEGNVMSEKVYNDLKKQGLI